MTGGQLLGSGTINGATTVGGTAIVSPGNSPGILNVNGFDLQPSGTLIVETGGNEAGTDYDQVNVTGSVTLAGILDVDIISSIVKGTPFTIINNDGVDPVV
jgi:hypothetical protein